MTRSRCAEVGPALLRTTLDGLVQVSWMCGRLGMARRRSPLLVQVLLFLLVTLLGVATSSVSKAPGVLPRGRDGLVATVSVGVWQRTCIDACRSTHV